MNSDHYLTEDGIKIPSIPEAPENLVLNRKSGGKRNQRKVRKTKKSKKSRKVRKTRK